MSLEDDIRRAERGPAERPMYDWDGLNEEDLWDEPLLRVAAVVLIVVSVAVVVFQVVKALGWFS